MRAVNLLPRDEAPKSFEKNRGVAFGAAGGAALVTAGLCTLILGAGGAIKDRQLTLDSLNAELASIPAAPAADASKDASLTAEKSARTGALSQALGGRIAWDGVLRQISQVLPDDVWLTTLTTAAPSSQPGQVATPATVSIVGSTYSQSGVARFLARLSVVPSLENVSLQSSLAAAAGTQKVVQFSINANIKPAGDAA
jgi:Tfp pilus assembly protein PilN